jgi:phage repressor protein C with HTH and peptisase S24 domain
MENVAEKQRWLKAERIRRKMSGPELAARATAIAKAAGAPAISQQSISGFENDTRKKRLPAWFIYVEKALTEALVPSETTAPSDEPLPPSNVIPALDAPPAPIMGSMPRDIPVMGTANGGRDDEFIIGEVIQYAPRPYALAGRTGIFAIFVVGHSMVPWRQPGEAVYVDRLRQPQIGSHVLVQMKATGPDGDPEHAAVVKRLVKVTPTHLVLAQYNPAKDDIRVPRSKVAATYRVLETDELLGV